MTPAPKLIKERPFLACTLSYLISIGISRLIVKTIESDTKIPLLGYNYVGGIHVHHFAYGILLLIIIAFNILYIQKTIPWYIFVLFGISLALIFDEFGIWIELDPYYHQLSSLVALIIIGSLLSMLTIHEYFKYRNT